jgi:hypothetical protein
MNRANMSLEKEIDEIPVVQVKIKLAGGVRQWVLGKCPICGGGHTHGAGSVGDKSPCVFLGHRVSHCPGFPHNSGYILVWDPADHGRYLKEIYKKNAVKKL